MPDYDHVYNWVKVFVRTIDSDSKLIESLLRKIPVKWAIIEYFRIFFCSNAFFVGSAGQMEKILSIEMRNVYFAL